MRWDKILIIMKKPSLFGFFFIISSSFITLSAFHSNCFADHNTVKTKYIMLSVHKVIEGDVHRIV